LFCWCWRTSKPWWFTVVVVAMVEQSTSSSHWHRTAKKWTSKCRSMARAVKKTDVLPRTTKIPPIWFRGDRDSSRLSANRSNSYGWYRWRSFFLSWCARRCTVTCMYPSHSWSQATSNTINSHFSSSHDYKIESEKICTTSICLPVYLEHLQVS
jgi:hypothetical protein